MVDFYKHNIHDWRGGTSALSHGAYRLYHVIVEQIMLHEGPAPYNPRVLAGLSNSRVEQVTRYYIPELIEAGKIEIIDGRISNDRASRELASIFKNRQNAGKGGRGGRGSADGPPDARRGPADVPPQVGRVPADGPLVVGLGSADGPPDAGRTADIIPLKENPNDFNGDETASLDRDGKPKRVEESKNKRREESFSLRSKDARAGEGDLLDSEGAIWPPDAFDRFWSEYPEKVGKGAAQKAFDKARKQSGVSFDFLINRLNAYKLRKPPDRSWCHPSTWLNEKRWLDEPAPAPMQSQSFHQSDDRPRTGAASAIAGIMSRYSKESNR